ncbi:AraC family transcriptional regulator [Vibrio sp. RE86]|uniref:AraC family transcriptional regulator n=1 Tax=Vibrio sp. RE86 TaxID=2607605 RepID=UPI0020A3844F|nr:AraC family transcriptional regulator [Vibrio sp. RE86]
MFNDLGIEIRDLLSYAGLPTGLFEQQKVQLTTQQYFQMWHGIEALSDQDEMPLKLAEILSFESCDVPIYAAMCSPNLNAAFLRLQEYKPLIGPMLLDIDRRDSYTELTLGCYGYSGELPKTLNLVEMIFFTQLARMATRQRIAPKSIELPVVPNNLVAYEAFFGCEIKQGDEAKIVFKAEDANKPFLTDNFAMLALFDKELQRKLEAVQAEDSIVDKVTTLLIGSLPQGESSIEYVAKEMAMSKRTLQRKLSAEKQSFQSVLQRVREELASHYLKHTDLPVLEVAFLLGFQEVNSFIRAYSTWTGVTPTQERGALNH